MSLTSQINNWIETIFKPTLEIALVETKEDILHEKQAQFVNHGANTWDAEEWPDVSDERKEQKKKKGNTDPDQSLVFTGLLSQSLEMDDDPYNFKIEIESGEAQKHADISQKWLSKKGSGHSFQTLSPIEREKAIDSIINNLRKGFGDAIS